MDKNQMQSPLDDLTYDLVTILHQKSKGLEAYGKYLSDAQSKPEVRSLLEQIRKQDVDAVERLRKVTAQCLEGTRSGSVP